MVVKLQGLPSNSSCVFEAEPGKLDLKRHEPAIIFISLQVGSGVQWKSA